MDPMDARLVRHVQVEGITRIRAGGDAGHPKDTTIEAAARHFGMRQDEIEVSVRHLEEIGFLSAPEVNKSNWLPNANMREFMRACYPEQQQGT